MFKIDLERSRWNLAIKAWLEGDASKLSVLLRGADRLPDFVRQFMADVVEGKVARKRGPKERVPRLRDAMIQVDFPLECERQKAIKKLGKKHGLACKGTPTERAHASIGRRFNLSAEAVKGIVYPSNPGKKKSKLNTKKSR